MYKLFLLVMVSLIAAGCSSQPYSEKSMNNEKIQARKQQMELIRTMDLMNQPQVVSASRV